MKTKQLQYINNTWKSFPSTLNATQCNLVLAFGSPCVITHPEVFTYLKNKFPNADIVMSSTAGEIMDDTVFDDTIVVTAIEFEKSISKCVQTNINQHVNSFEAGSFLMDNLVNDNLKAVFIISDGTFTNGSDLVNGFNSKNSHLIPITGGMAGDADRFEKTFTSLNSVPTQGNVIAVGFYGENLLIGHGSLGGWDEFGHERIITKSEKNVLYEIDHKNALDLYKEYLGPYVSELPASALLFPLSIMISGSEKSLVRTILSIDEEHKTMTFAGNLPIGSKVRLMKANFEKLITSSSIAAKNSFLSLDNQKPDLAILVSCVGRKLVLQERTEEEVEAAKRVLGEQTTITGFYSYGEISPFDRSTRCELHNQTMNITTITEV
jgi:hypothetical protein